MEYLEKFNYIKREHVVSTQFLYHSSEAGA